jgi:hypothetical protein
MKTRIRNITTADIDRHSNELMREFFEHYEEVRAAEPDKQDINVIFQGWAIQKISSLQLIVVELTRCLNALGAAEADSTPPRPRRRRPRP